MIMVIDMYDYHIDPTGANGSSLCLNMSSCKFLQGVSMIPYDSCWSGEVVQNVRVITNGTNLELSSQVSQSALFYEMIRSRLFL